MMRLPRRFAGPAIAFLGLPVAGAAQESAAIFDGAVVVWDGFSRVTNVPDLDGDGFSDAIGTWYSTTPGSTVTVRAWRNDGTGAFSPLWSVDFPGVGGSPLLTRMATGDFDLDGDDDFVLALNLELRFFLSNGAAPPTPWATVTTPQAVKELEAADFDGDGRIDVAYVAASGTAANVNVLFTGPAGPMTPPSTASLTVNALHALFVAQVEADGLPDVGVASKLNILVDVALYPVSAGGLGTPAVFPLGIAGIPMPAAGDIDGDGDADAVVFTLPAQYYVLRRTGPSSFALEAPVAGGPATGLADVDGDGDLDGVCCGGGGGPFPSNGNISFFEIAINDGGVFASPFSILGLGSTRLAGAVDVDADGDVDLVAGRCVYYADGGITAPPTVPVTGTPPERHAVTDPDRDGDPDIGFGLSSSLRNAADGTFASVPTLAPAPPPGTTFGGLGWAGDYDGDGDVDLVVTHLDGSNLLLGMRLLRNNGGGGLVDGGYAAALGADMRLVTTGFGQAVAPMTPAGALPADADGDGDLDLVVRALGIVGGTRIWWNDGTGFFVEGPNLTGTYAKAVADLDANPAPDLISLGAAFSGSGSLLLHRGLGGGAFAPYDPTPIFQYSEWTDRIEVADFDGDGDLDVAGVDGVVPVIRLNDGNGNFAPGLSLTPWVAALGGRRVLAADVDEDGVVDLVVGPAPVTGNLGASIYLGTGAPLAYAPPLVQMVSPAVLADVDGDGDLDGIGTSIHRNRCFSGPAAGMRLQYGDGLAGSGGMKPVLGGVGPFRPGTLCETRITGALGGSAGIFALGTQPENLPLLGGTLLASPQVLFGFPLAGTPGVGGEGECTIPWLAPPGLAGFTLYQQVGVVDFAAPQGISLSNGLRYTIGQ